MNEGFGILTLLALLPLIGSIAVVALPAHAEELAKRVALAFALAAFGLGVVVAFRFDPAAEGYQMVESLSWIPALGVSWTLGLDGLGLVLTMMSLVLVPVVLLAAWREHGVRIGAGQVRQAAVVGVGAGGSAGGGGLVEEAVGEPRTGASEPMGSLKGYLALILLAQAMMVAVFTSLDVFVFYVFFEAILIPLYFMIGRYGTGRRAYAAVKFLIYSLVGGLLMLAALAALWALSADQLGAPDFTITALRELELTGTQQAWLFWGFFIAFAVKAPLVPVHTWLPDAAGSARPSTSVLMIGVLDKIGTFGMMRLCLQLFPDASKQFAPIVIALALTSIIYGALLAVGQADMRRLFAYISISHFGFITMGIFAFTSQGLSGATLYMLGHGLSTAAMFCVLGYLVARRGSTSIADYGGVSQVAPVLAGMFLIAMLSAIALPGMVTFTSEFLVLVGTFARYPWVAVVAAFVIVIAALYALWLYQRTMTGPAAEAVRGIPEINSRELLAIAPVVVLLVVLGFYPKPVLDVANPTTDALMEQLQMTDPVPATERGEGDQ